MPIKLILNPNADLGRGITHLQTIKETAAAQSAIDIALTQGAGDARRLTREAIEEGYDLIVAAGGDGTVNEVVNGLMMSQSAGVKLGVVPIGTGNDFAYAAGIAGETHAAARNLFGGRSRTIDLALIEDDKGRQCYFANNLGVGFDANVVIRTAEITNVHGFMKYFLGVLSALSRDYHPFHMRMEFDDEQVVQEIFFVSMGIGPRHGGGFLLTPDASQGDDRVDSCAATMLGRLRAVSLLNSAIKGTHIHTPYVTMRQNKRILIQSAEPLPIHVDGEIYARPQDAVHQVRITSVPGALEIIY